MATITKSIGTTGRDYSTITLWEAALGGAAGGAGNDAVGECYNDSAFNESFIIDDTTPNSITLTVPEAERHDGTEGTGVRIVNTSAAKYTISSTGLVCTVEWIEFDWNGNANSQTNAFWGHSNDSATVHFIRNNILHGLHNTGSALHSYVLSIALGRFNVTNNIIYDLLTTNAGIYLFGLFASSGLVYSVDNNTVHNVICANALTGGIRVVSDSDLTIKNNISTSCSKDFSFLGTNPDSDYNLSSDLTSDDGGGTHNLTEKAAANQFVSTVGGSEDLHLKAGADAIDVGYDLGTTPTGVNIDINGRDRDAEGDTWDIGAHEYVDAGTNVDAGLISTKITLNAATVQIDCTLAAGLQSLGITHAAASVALGQILTPNAQTLAITQPAASIVIDCTFEASAISAMITPQAPTVSAGITYQAAAQSLEFTQPAAAVVVDYALAAALQTMVVTLPGAATTSDVLITPATIAAAITMPASGLSADCTLTIAATQSLVVTVYESSVGQNIYPETIAATLTIQTPTVTADYAFAANTQVLALTQPAATAYSDYTATPATLSTVLTMPASTVVIDASIQAALLSVVLSQNPSQAVIDFAHSAAAQTLTIDIPAPEISGGEVVEANLQTLALTLNAATQSSLNGAVGELTVAFTALKPGVNFSFLKPGVAFTPLRPGVSFSAKTDR